MKLLSAGRAKNAQLQILRLKALFMFSCTLDPLVVAYLLQFIPDRTGSGLATAPGGLEGVEPGGCVVHKDSRRQMVRLHQHVGDHLHI